MDKKAIEVIGASLKRAVQQKEYKENIYGKERKTEQSKGIRVDKRKFNKGRPKVRVDVPPKKDIITPSAKVASKKLNEIEQLAGRILARYMRAKIDANDLQPAIWADIVERKIKEKMDKGEPINYDKLGIVPDVVKGGVKEAKKKGRPVGAKDKAPRKKKDT